MSRAKGKGQSKYNPQWTKQQAERRFNLREKWTGLYSDAKYRDLVTKTG